MKKTQLLKQKERIGLFWKRLGLLKNTNKGLNGGEKSALNVKINSSNPESILIFSRKKEGISKDYFANEKMKFSKDKKIVLKVWEYKIFFD